MIQNIGIIGQGKFGTLLLEILPAVFPDAEMVSISRGTMSEVHKCDLVIPAVPINNFADVIDNIAPILKDQATVMDVCSVKLYPVSVMKGKLPSHIQIIATHPMFGPGTVKKIRKNLKGLRIVMEQVRGSGAYHEIRESFRKAGFKIVDMSADEHDRFAAEFHFSSHVIAAIIKKIRLSRSPIDTKSVESLFDFVEMVQTDDTELLKEMYTYNPFCKKQLEKINLAYQSINTLLKQK